MVVCLVFLSVNPGSAKTMQPNANKSCCHKTSKQLPGSPKPDNDCGSGACNIMLACSGCGFFKVEPITVNALVPVLTKVPVTPYLMRDLSDYSLISWNPPKV